MQMGQLVVELLHLTVTTDVHCARTCMGLYYPIIDVVELFLLANGVQKGVGPLNGNIVPASPRASPSTPKQLVSAELEQVRPGLPQTILQIVSRGRQLLHRLAAAYAESPKFVSAVVPKFMGTARVPVLSYLFVAADFRRNMKPLENKAPVLTSISVARTKSNRAGKVVRIKKSCCDPVSVMVILQFGCSPRWPSLLSMSTYAPMHINTPIQKKVTTEVPSYNPRDFFPERFLNW